MSYLHVSWIDVIRFCDVVHSDLQRAHTIPEVDAQEDLSAVLAAMRLDPVASVHHLRSPAAAEEKTTCAQRPHAI